MGRWLFACTICTMLLALAVAGEPANVKPSALDRLDATRLTAAGLPKEVVAVLGRYHLPPFGSSNKCVVFTADGKQLAATIGGVTAFVDPARPKPSTSAVVVWDVATRRQQFVLFGHRGDIQAVAFARDGKTLATGGRDGAVRLWDLSNTPPRERGSLAYRGPVWSLSFAPHGKTLAVGLADPAGQSLRLVDLSGAAPKEQAALGAQLGADPKRPPLIYSVAFAPDGQTLAYSDGNTPRLRTPDSDIPLGKLNGISVAFAPDGKSLASIGNSYTVRLWDLTKAPPEEKQSFGQREAYFPVAFAPDGKVVATGSARASVLVWDVAGIAAKKIAELKPKAGYVLGLAFGKEGRTLAESGPNNVQLWELVEGAYQDQALEVGEDLGLPLAFAPDGAVVCQSSAGPVRLALGNERPAAGGGFPALEKPLATDGRVMAVAVGNNIELREIPAGKARVTLEGHTGRIQGAAFTADGTTLMSISVDNTARLWDTASGKERVRFNIDSGIQSKLALSANGKRAAIGMHGTVQLWDLAKERPQQFVEIEMRERLVQGVKLSPDGKTLAVGGLDLKGARPAPNAQAREYCITLWDVAGAEPKQGAVLAVGSPWQVPPPLGTRFGLPLKEPPPKEPPPALNDGMAFSPDGKLLAVVGEDARLSVFDASPGNGKMLHDFPLPGPAAGVTVASDGRHVAVLSDRGQVYIFRLPSPQSGGDNK